MNQNTELNSNPKSNLVTLVNHLMKEMQLRGDSREAGLRIAYYRGSVNYNDVDPFGEEFEASLKVLDHLEQNFPQLYSSIQKFPIEWLGLFDFDLGPKIKDAITDEYPARFVFAEGPCTFLRFSSEFAPDLLSPCGIYVSPKKAHFSFEYLAFGNNAGTSKYLDGRIMHKDELAYRYLGPMLDKLRGEPMQHLLSQLFSVQGMPKNVVSKVQNSGNSPDTPDFKIVFPSRPEFYEAKLRRDGIVIRLNNPKNRYGQNSSVYRSALSNLMLIDSRINQPNYIQRLLPEGRFNAYQQRP